MSLKLKHTSESYSDQSKFPGFTLVLPSVSVGNVGQLALDVFLSSVQPEKVADVWDEALLPVVGIDPVKENSSDLMTACQLYSDEKSKTIFMQIRSGIARGHSKSFVERLSNWIESKEFSKVVVLTSSLAEERVDSQLGGAQIRFVGPEEKSDEMKSLGLIELEKRDRAPGQMPLHRIRSGDAREEENDSEMFMPGCGFAKALIKKSKSSQSPERVPPHFAFLAFCSEGDNSGDALQLLAAVDRWLNVIPKRSDNNQPKIMPPVSWKNLFGPPTSRLVY